MLGIGCVGVWVLVRRSLCLFWRETCTKGLCARFATRPEEDEGRKVPETVGRREQSRERQSAEGSKRDQSTEQVSPEMRVGQRGDQ